MEFVEKEVLLLNHFQWPQPISEQQVFRLKEVLSIKRSINKFGPWRIFSGSRNRFRNRRGKKKKFLHSRSPTQGKYKKQHTKQENNGLFRYFLLLKFIYCALKSLYKLLQAEFTSLFQITRHFQPILFFFFLGGRGRTSWVVTGCLGFSLGHG